MDSRLLTGTANIFSIFLDKLKLFLYNESKFHRTKSEEQKQVTVTTVAQRARQRWKPAHTMTVNGFVRSTEKGVRPPVPAAASARYSGRVFMRKAAYLLCDVISQCTLFKGNVSFPN